MHFNVTLNRMWRAILITGVMLSGAAAVQADAFMNLLRAHSHNDYAQKNPLSDALMQGFSSVEADIYFEEGQIVVTHDLPEWEALLKENYLDPLQERVNLYGAVYEDKRPFYLWIDVKRGGDDLDKALIDMLANYGMLSVFSDEKIKWGPVTAILTGDAAFKEQYVEKPVRRAVRDSNGYSADDPSADHKWMWYAVSWRSLFDWRGVGPMPDDEREKLHAVVADMHGKGRAVRFYAAPDNPHYWEAALKAGVDHINTDYLKDLGDFLRAYEGEAEQTPLIHSHIK